MKTWMIKNGIDRINRGRFITNANMNIIDMNTEFKIPNMNNFIIKYKILNQNGLLSFKVMNRWNV